ncbi:uncharacterized protein DUF3467 [Geothermobacter ehrlichii]|uniref:Uncharacterized protein DUF3467 n=1 Tax=Geothermobacter ehrlichii TaxID=213224 RepID=A0A5D3WH02_9BACT|nr:DUF3467 domain-containing protein [Geothermobacter ehrlichii]TYO96370.1 uncharacterized protein DUF3467 [Geothermobacter ehrlichii]
MSDEKRREIRIEIQLDEETAQGAYANLAVVNHTDAEFVLDFIYVQPQAPRAKVRSRIITSPRHVKRLLRALQDNLDRYEARFGSVEDVAADDPATVGDYH